jgi:2-polyprenyl-3-methyl-5-hydroxy-6-metoxy-1,4-benzoquinol methylase
MPVLERALAFFGDIRGRTVVELGCGPGAASLYLADLGAEVTAIDVSQKAIDDLAAHCATHGIRNVRAICTTALDIGALGPVDFVYGSMILHHIEPFDRFVPVLRELVKPGGKAFFYENSAMSSLLVWFRTHVVGKFWVPKYGDDQEFPLTPAEVRELGKQFDVQVEIPEMLFFALAGQYLLRGRLMVPLSRLDRAFYRRGWLTKYSYRQYVMLSDGA